MKKIINNMKVTLSILLAIGVLALSMHSCTKESVVRPEITKIRLTDPTQAEVSLEKAQPGTYIVIEGKNLTGATQVLINDFPVFFNTTLNTDTYIIVQIPSNVPTPDRGDVSNTIKVVTPAGEAVYTFNTLPPPPVLTSIYNYNPKPGTAMQITGEHLFGVNEVVFPGGKKGTNITKNDDGTVLTVTVPADLDPMVSDYLHINSPFGNVVSWFKVNTLNAQGAFATFDATSAPMEPGCGCWYTVPNSPTMDNAMYPNSTGNYIRLTFGATGAIDGNQTATGRAFNYGGPATKVILDPSVLSQAPDDYYLLFEMNTKKPITGGALRVSFGSAWSSYSGSYQYDILLAKDAPGKVFDTKNTWKTIAVPLKNLVLWTAINWNTYEAASTTPLTSLSQLFKASGSMNGFALKTLATQSSGAFSAFDAAFDNFRIEKIAK